MNIYIDYLLILKEIECGFKTYVEKNPEYCKISFYNIQTYKKKDSYFAL